MPFKADYLVVVLGFRADYMVVGLGLRPQIFVFRIYLIYFLLVWEVQRLVRERKPWVVCIQETKLEVVYDFFM